MGKKSSMATAAFIGVASVWVGGHIGPGFATGTSLTTWFLAYGVSGLFLPLISMAITAGVMYYMIEYARSNKVNNYKEYAVSLYGSGSKIMLPLYDLSFLGTTVCAGGICLSGLAALLEAHIGMPYWVGIGLIIAVTALLCLYGSKLVSMASTYMMYFIIGTVVLIVVMSFAFGNYDLAGSVANSTANARTPSFLTALLNAVLYGSFQSTIAFNVVAVTDLLKEKSESKKAAISGYFINIGLLLMACVMIFSYTNVFDIVNETLPIYSILSNLGFGWLTWLYVLLMVLAVLTSVAGMAYTGTVRFAKVFSFVKHEQARKIIIVAILLGFAAVAASFGLKSIMSVGNTILGYLSIVAVVIPAYTITRAKLKKQRAEGASEEAKS